MKKFKIEYEDQDTGEKFVEYCEFENWTGRATYEGEETGPLMTITAKEWAEDLAYSLADKGPYTVTEI